MASDLDYLRDVVEFVEFSDSERPVSITKAIRLFLKSPEPTIPVSTAEEFLAKVLK